MHATKTPLRRYADPEAQAGSQRHYVHDHGQDDAGHVPAHAVALCQDGIRHCQTTRMSSLPPCASGEVEMALSIDSFDELVGFLDPAFFGGSEDSDFGGATPLLGACHEFLEAPQQEFRVIREPQWVVAKPGGRGRRWIG